MMYMQKTLINAFLMVLLFSSPVFAYSDLQIVNAIYRAENSKKYPYGILKTYRHTSPRQACFNSVRSARQWWYNANCPGDFIVFLGLTYSPPVINPYWVKNVHYFLDYDASRKIQKKN